MKMKCLMNLTLTQVWQMSRKSHAQPRAIAYSLADTVDPSGCSRYSQVSGFSSSLRGRPLLPTVLPTVVEPFFEFLYFVYEPSMKNRHCWMERARECTVGRVHAFGDC